MNTPQFLQGLKKLTSAFCISEHNKDKENKRMYKENSAMYTQ